MRLWLVCIAVIVVIGCLQAYGLATWPMADDEVPTLAELGRFRVYPRFFSVPSDQIGRVVEALPVWYAVQRSFLSVLPPGEVSLRIPSLVWGVLTSAVVFLLGARWRGLFFGLALSLVLGGTQLFLLVSQVNRFYSLPLLLVVLTLAAIWIPRAGWLGVPIVVAMTALTVLSHNITIPVFGLALVASCLTALLAPVPRYVWWRSGAAALTSVLIYGGFVRHILQGWQSTGNPTPVLVSFAAHAGVPILALALAGCWFAFVAERRNAMLIWCIVLWAGSLALFQFTHINWNPRYFLFFLPPVWVMAAYSMDVIQRKLGSGSLIAAWYGIVAVLLLPGVLSHLQDGSRHDYRRAAGILMENARPGEPIFSDDAETLSYYLPEYLLGGLNVRTKMRRVPASDFYLVVRSAAWTPLPVVPQRRMDLLAEISRRRFDTFSHILRVYRVSAEVSP